MNSNGPRAPRHDPCEVTSGVTMRLQGASSLGSKAVASTWPNARCDSSCIISCCSRALERWERSGLRGTLNRHGAERDRQMRGRRAALRHQSTRRSRPASSFANSHTRVAVAGSRICPTHQECEKSYQLCIPTYLLQASSRAPVRVESSPSQ